MKINAIVVDDSKEFTNNLVRFCKCSNDINLMKTLEDGESAIEYLKANSSMIDCIIMDIILPKLDGISILEYLKNSNYKGHIIILSGCKKDYMIEVTQQYNVDYYMLKPCNYESLIDRIINVSKEEVKNTSLKEQPEVALQVSKLLHELGVPAQIKGYQYLREGIMMIYENNDYIGGITKEVYPEIASRYNTTSSRVERAMRHAIEVSWNRADYETMNRIFGHSIDFDRAKPTNSEFLVTLSDNLRLHNRLVKS